MEVQPVGCTFPFLPEDLMEEEEISQSENLLEFAGRTCYLSYSKPNPATRSQVDYLSHIIESGHLSVLEHVSVTFHVTGVSRTLLTELERHRHLSFSVVSQRYVDQRKLGYVVPPQFEDDPVALRELEGIWSAAIEHYAWLYERLRQKGLGVKQAREAARAVLPGMAETQFVVTGNLRTWREIIAKRIDPHADAEIQRFAQQILVNCYDLFPGTFIDMKREFDDQL